jgi:DNA-directed RNA polymerase specialized sigma24 family protein
VTPEEAFDELYVACAPTLIRQTYLLTGRHGLALDCVERAFRDAWHRWPEVALDPDPPSWVRAVAHDHALSPWRRHGRRRRRRERRHERREQRHERREQRRERREQRHERREQRHERREQRHERRRGRRYEGRERRPLTGSRRAALADRALLAALRDLPPLHRRTLLLYDGLGLDLPETAAETEASTAATAGRLRRAREAVAARLPELADPETLRRRMAETAHAATSTARSRPARPPAVRRRAERLARWWTGAAAGATAVLGVLSLGGLVTAATEYEPPAPEGERVREAAVPGAPGPPPSRSGGRKLRTRPEEAPGSAPAPPGTRRADVRWTP